MSEQLSNKVKITKIAAGAASAGTAVEATVLDMQGYEGVLIFGTIATANAGNFLKVQSGTDATVTDAADLEGTKVVAAANAETVWLDIFKPRERYIKAIIIRAGANTATGDLFALQYNGRVGFETNLTTNVIIGEAHISPAEGTV